MTNKSTLAQGLSHAWPWTKPIGSSPTTSRLLRYSLLCMLVLLCGGNAWAKDVTATLTGANLMASTSPSTSYTDYTASETFTGLKDNQGNAYFGRWTYQKSGNYLNMVQIKKVESSNSSRIMLPKYSGDIKKITLNVTDANSTDFSTGNGAKTQLAIIKGTTFTANFAKNSDNQVIVKGSNSVANKTYEFDFTELETKYDGKDLYICSIDAAARIWSIEVIYSDTPSDSRVETVVELSKGYATSGEIGATLQLPTATVKAGTTVIDGASVTWESSDESVATINAEAGTISLLKKGTTTIKATYAGDDKNYLGSYVYYNVTVLGNIEDGIFDFSIGRDYGSGAVVDNSNYMTDSKTWTAGNVTMVTSGKYRWHTDNTFRIYSSDDNDNPTKLVLSVPDGNVITKIVLTGNSDISTITATSGTYANGTWTGKAQSVTLLRGTANAQIKTITVTYTSASVPEAPTFSPAAGTYYTGQYVEISCTTEGATIKKSYDGENFETYNEAFPVMEDKTIWAYAEKNGEQSEIVSASYIIGSTYDSFAPMQEAAAAEGFSNKAIQYRATGGMVVAYVNGKNAYLIDGSGNGILAYNKDGLGDLAAGQKMNYDDGYLTATLENYQGNAELTGIVFPEMTGGTVTVTPVEKKLPLTSANQSTLVTLKNLTYNANAKTLSDGTNTITFYDKFKTNVTLEDGKTYDVTGIVVMYNTTNNSTIEICPRTADDVVVAAAPAEDTYVVAGGFKDSNEQWTEGCFGTQWAPTLVDNQLVKQDNGTYSKTYENVEIAEKTTIEYKICTNGQYPEGENKWYYFEKAGTYDITFTYDPNATDGDGITMTATLKYESVYAVGDGLGTLTDWSFADDNKLTESTETPGVYSITYNNVPASEAVFKFALDRKWDHNFGGTKDGDKAFSATIGTEYDAVYDGANISITTTETSNITLTLDLSNFDFTTKQGAKFTITSEAVEEPAGDVTATWDFRGETPTPATLTKVNVESKATYYPSNNAIAALYVNALNGKLAYNSSGYAQFNAGTILRVPVYTTDDVVTVTAYPGQYKYTIGGSAATADETVHTATAEEVSKGYVEIVATGGAYLYAITMKTTQTAAKHAVWNFLNEIPTTITGTEINSTTGSVASSVEGIALDVNGYLKARGTDGWIKTNTTMNVPVKTEGDIVTVMAYSTQYDNYTVGGKDASNNESPIYTYKATATDATNGYVTIATSNQQAYIYAISVQQLPVKEPTTLDNKEATVTWALNAGNITDAPTYAEGTAEYFVNAYIALGDNFTQASDYPKSGNSNDSNGTDQTLFNPATATTSSTGEYVEFMIKPKANFKPTNVSFSATKYGTDAPTVKAVWVKTDGTEVSLSSEPVAIARNKKDPNVSTLSYKDELSAIDAARGICGLRIYVTCANNKQVGFNNVQITGTLNGEVVDAETATINVTIDPEGAGEVAISPKGTEQEVGTEITLKQTKNFGYAFDGWYINDEKVGSEDSYTFELNANTDITAKYTAVETYALTVNVEGGNSYQVTASPEATDGKYEAGTEVTLTAVENPVVKFTNWSTSATEKEIKVTINEDTEITANFAATDEIVAAWDFYEALGNSGKQDRAAAFKGENNDGTILTLRNAEGTSVAWLDRNYTNPYNGAICAINWQKKAYGEYYWQTKVNASSYKTMKVYSEMYYNYRAYNKYDVQYSVDGTEWTTLGTFELSKDDWSKLTLDIPEAADNKEEVYVRWIKAEDAVLDETASDNGGNYNDGIGIANIFITGTKELVDDGTAPVLQSQVPAANSENASINGQVVLTFDEKIQLTGGTKATLGEEELEPIVAGKALMFKYQGLDYDTEYTFTLPANFVSDLMNNTLEEEISFTFKTMTRPTVTKAAYDFIVPDDGTFAEAVAAANSRSDKTKRYFIFVKKGEYQLMGTGETENAEDDDHNPYTYTNRITDITASNISIIGEDRDATILYNSPDHEGIGVTATLRITKDVENTYIEDITIKNAWEYTGTTGRAVTIQDKGTRTIAKNVKLLSYQDTYYSNNQSGEFFFEDGEIHGTVDFVCGTGDVIYKDVTLYLEKRTGNVISAPNQPKEFGYVFLDCTIDGDAANEGTYYLGRPWGTGVKAQFVNTQMKVTPAAAGWTEMGAGRYPAVFAEFNSYKEDMSPIDLSGRKTSFGASSTTTAVESSGAELTTEQVASLTVQNIFGDWLPTQYTIQEEAPSNVKIDQNGKLTWDADDYALCYVVCADGDAIAVTTENSFDTATAGAPALRRSGDTVTYTVRAANAMGGLGEESAAASPATGINATLNDSTKDSVIYDLNGRRVMTPTKGVYIINGKKVVIK